MKRMHTPITLLLALIVIVVVSYKWLDRAGEGQQLSEKQGIPYIAIMAHRGLSNLAPEATEPAFKLALAMGADYLETDIQRTKDGVLVCFHDDTLERNTDAATVFPGREKDPISTFTYNELMQLDLGSWFNEAFPTFARPSFKGVKILRLDQVIDIAESGVNRPGLYLETKSPERHPGVEKEIIDMLTSRGWIGSDLPSHVKKAQQSADDAATIKVADGPARVILQSFEDTSVAIMKDLAPQVPRVYLVDQELEKEKGGWQALINIAKENGADLGPVGYQAWPWRNTAAHESKVLLHHYTINLPWQMRLLRFFGTDGIFTNRADLALKLYRDQKLLPVEDYFQEIGY